MNREQLAEVVSAAWNVTAGVRVEPCAAATERGPEVWAQVPLKGAWSGVLAMGAPKAALDVAAAVMFGCAVDDVTDQDRQDVALELVNVVGGNLAPVFGDGCLIGLPSPGASCEGDSVLRQEFALDGMTIVAACFESVPAGH
ncbi:MAG: chemotaxis protein CheX [Planctomycetota bacterium]